MLPSSQRLPLDWSSFCLSLEKRVISFLIYFHSCSTHRRPTERIIYPFFPFSSIVVRFIISSSSIATAIMFRTSPVNKISKRPSLYPSFAFHLIRTGQFLSSVIVLSILSFFVHYLHVEHIYVPWTFLLVR